MEEEMFKNLLHHLMGAPHETQPGIQVATLKPEDVTWSRTLLADRNAIRGEMRVLKAKIQALMAKEEALHAESWERLYTAYNLPRDGNYEVKDGVILKYPKDAIPICVCGNCK